MIWLGIKLLIKLQTLQKNSQQNNWDRVTNENDKDIPNERYVSPEKRQEIVVDLKLTYKHNSGISKSNKFDW